MVVKSKLCVKLRPRPSQKIELVSKLRTEFIDENGYQSNIGSGIGLPISLSFLFLNDMFQQFPPKVIFQSVCSHI